MGVRGKYKTEPFKMKPQGITETHTLRNEIEFDDDDTQSAKMINADSTAANKSYK